MAYRLNVSACILAKNNADTIERAVYSVVELCREVIVLDTGSSDGTDTLASRLGAEVHYSQWNDHFAEARNTAIDLCSSKWILMLDSDEELRSVPEFLEELLLDDAVGAYECRIHNVLEDGTISEHTFPRLFRNLPEVHYEGRIHEQVRPSIDKLGLKVTAAEIDIMHYGYQHNNQEKVDRNRELLAKDAQENGTNSFNAYHSAQTEFSSGNTVKAAELFEQALQTEEQLSIKQREFARLRLAQIALGNGQSNLVDSYLEFDSDSIQHAGFNSFLKAVNKVVQHDFQSAFALLEDERIRQSGMVPQKELDQLLTLCQSQLNNH